MSDENLHEEVNDDRLVRVQSTDVESLLQLQERNFPILEQPSGLGVDVPIENDDMDDIYLSVNIDTVPGGRLFDEELYNFIGVHFPDERLSIESRPIKSIAKPETNRRGTSTPAGVIFIHILMIYSRRENSLV
jgi:hypothetical protein